MPDGGAVYAANAQNDLSVIDTTSNTVAQTILLGRQGPTGVTAQPDGSAVYVANAVSNNLSVITR